MVQVRLQDGFLAEFLFEAMREPGFAEFPVVGPRSIEHVGANKLLRDRAGALDDAAAPEVRDHRGADTPQIDAVMLVETPILGGQHSRLKRLRHFLEYHRNPVLLVERGDDAALRVVDERRLRAIFERQPVLDLVDFLLDLVDAEQHERHRQ